MIKANTKYTAKELVIGAGFNPEQIGKVRVLIGGLVANDPDYVIRVSQVGKLTVVVGTDSADIEVTEASENVEFSEEAKKINDAESESQLEKNAELAEAKEEQDK